MVLEICTGTLAGIEAAARGGADRIELCSGLSEGGLTPSIGLIRAAVSRSSLKTHVLIRPRGGDFLYTPAEQALCLNDITEALRAGAHGVVVGALTEHGEIDAPFLTRCVETAHTASPSASVTFHRAFDLADRPFDALETIISCGCQRLLSSGQADTAEHGTALLKQLVERAAERLIIMPGCGVTPDNAAFILNATGATELHASARSLQPSAMKMRRSNVAMGSKGSDEYALLDTSQALVSEIRRKIFQSA